VRLSHLGRAMARSARIIPYAETDGEAIMRALNLLGTAPVRL
jgi:hypothetical protein